MAHDLSPSSSPDAGFRLRGSAAALATGPTRFLRAAYTNNSPSTPTHRLHAFGPHVHHKQSFNAALIVFDLCVSVVHACVCVCVWKVRMCGCVRVL